MRGDVVRVRLRTGGVHGVRPFRVARAGIDRMAVFVDAVVVIRRRQQIDVMAIVRVRGESAPSTTAVPPRWRRMSSAVARSEEHTSELQSLMRISYAVFCLKKKT